MQKIILIFLFFSIIVVMGERLLYEPNAPDYRATSAEEPQSLFDKLAPDTTLSTFMDVLMQVDDVLQLLNDSKSTSSSFTIFCPVNAAFRNELDVYTREHLDEFLKNHVVPLHKLDEVALKKSSSLPTMLKGGEPIQVEYHVLTQRVVLNEHATVDMKHAVEAVNGIAYKIDHLLRPYHE